MPEPAAYAYGYDQVAIAAEQLTVPVNGLFKKLVMERHLGLSDANAPIRICYQPVVTLWGDVPNKQSRQR